MLPSNSIHYHNNVDGGLSFCTLFFPSHNRLIVLIKDLITGLVLKHWISQEEYIVIEGNKDWSPQDWSSLSADSNKENIDPNVSADRTSAEQEQLEKDIFGGSSDLSDTRTLSHVPTPQTSPVHTPQLSPYVVRSPDPYAVSPDSPLHPNNNKKHMLLDWMDSSDSEVEGPPWANTGDWIDWDNVSSEDRESDWLEDLHMTES